MNLNLREIKGSGDIAQERLVCTVVNDTDIGSYLVFSGKGDADGVYAGWGTGYWLENKKVTKGDKVIIYTKKGEYKTKDISETSKSHFVYLNRTQTLWDQPGRAALLFFVGTNFTKCRVGGFDDSVDTEPEADLEANA
jgi:hypothetical protein